MAGNPQEAGGDCRRTNNSVHSYNRLLCKKKTVVGGEGEAFWSGGYFYRSVGSTTSKAIQYYVERSQRKHWTALDYEEYKHRKNTQTTINQFIT